MNKDYMLKRFQEEVMRKGSDATLPSNLTDFWLEKLQDSLQRVFECLGDDSGSDNDGSMSLVLAAIIHILFAKNGGLVTEASMEEMFKYFEDYRVELALEAIRRKTNVQVEPATINSIFTSREVHING
ncbi:hypothetical protein [Pseudomonas xanthosomatis]|uniref:hypothetical protein n=1 Tax=Pseudomonas xanthosomatis TaxID=2842356 RepID=UPI003517A466